MATVTAASMDPIKRRRPVCFPCCRSCPMLRLIGFTVVLSVLQATCVRSQWVDETLTGTVEGGKFAHYSLSKPGRVIITLTPKEGDPDVYVGENGTEPDYRLDRHTYQSTTCGVDRVIVPVFAPRPISIGVYGHPSHAHSIYELHVRVDDEKDAYEEALLSEQGGTSPFVHGYDQFGYEEHDDDDTAAGTSDGDSSTAERHGKKSPRRGAAREASARSEAAAPVIASEGSRNTGGGGGGSGSTSHSNAEPAVGTGDWEDWDEFPVYNIFLTLLKLFWEMLLTL